MRGNVMVWGQQVVQLMRVRPPGLNRGPACVVVPDIRRCIPAVNMVKITVLTAAAMVGALVVAPSPLLARITAGAAARAGTGFGYLVTLTNPTARPFSLRPCPSYAEFLGGLMGSGAAHSHLVRYYYLNCGTVQSIPARGSVTYQMELPLPPRLPVGFYSKLDWQIQGGAGPAVATSLTVEPRSR
jgi:hypothetical protein